MALKKVKATIIHLTVEDNEKARKVAESKGLSLTAYMTDVISEAIDRETL